MAVFFLLIRNKYNVKWVHYFKGIKKTLTHFKEYYYNFHHTWHLRADELSLQTIGFSRSYMLTHICVKISRLVFRQCEEYRLFMWGESSRRERDRGVSAHRLLAILCDPYWPSKNLNWLDGGTHDDFIALGFVRAFRLECCNRKLILRIVGPGSFGIAMFE